MLITFGREVAQSRARSTHQAACFEDGGAHIARKGPVQQPRHLGKLLAAHRCLAVGLGVARERISFLVGTAKVPQRPLTLGAYLLQLCPSQGTFSERWSQESEAQPGGFIQRCSLQHYL